MTAQTMSDYHAAEHGAGAASEHRFMASRIGRIAFLFPSRYLIMTDIRCRLGLFALFARSHSRLTPDCSRYAPRRVLRALVLIRRPLLALHASSPNL